MTFEDLALVADVRHLFTESINANINHSLLFGILFRK